MPKKLFSNLSFFILIASAVRILLISLPSFEYDENAYRVWTARLVELGPAKFYDDKFFTNNPLGGLYVFWVTGIIKDVLFPNLSFFSKSFDPLLKLPANIADIAAAILIYLLIKKYKEQKWATFGFLMYALNPALFFNSAIFGQYDGLAALFLIISTLLLLNKKAPEIAASAFALAIVTKPQTIFFAPVLMFSILLTYRFSRSIFSLFTFLLVVFILYWPFFPNSPILGILYVNQNSANLFNCTTCFAFNFWGIFGNWQKDLQTILNIPLVYWGVILLAITLIPVLLLKPHAKKFKPPFFYLTAAIFAISFFMFLTRMHERYLFSFFPFLLLSAILLKSRFLIGFYIFMSIMHFLNVYLAYAYYNNLLKLTNLPVDILISNFKLFSFVSFLSFIILFKFFLNYVKPKINA